ncbi:septum site-determining protein MinC (plasmid) [Paracoccus sp. MA]|uniref:septum site-determining protein MinC n=1 Tax=Paracoccus sp. MA TaxID=2895796 RepID=UPI001E621B88|nr:septum site-determining protein MinC [Paracoccus sp. MA]UFM67258.1 septum site-determining protein MinC [Paracoccus sp. MA]
MQSGKSAAQTVATVKPLQIRGRTFTAIALHLSGRPDRAFFEALEARLNQTPLFFDNAPLVVDLEQAQGLDSAAELIQLTAELRRRKLSVFGVQSGTAAQARAAAEAGLISLPGGRDIALERVSRQGSRPEPVREPAPAPAAKEPANRMVTQPVRSGQTVFADRGDLIVVGSVGSGAEVIAAGNIHIYGRLRGRALAGVHGDASARIFCHALDAELLAIAGLYRTSENLGPDTPRQHVQVYLQGEVLRIESLT